MKLSVIIVNYNVRYYLEQCIVSVLRAADGIAHEIFVVDNHSSDGSVDYLKQRFPDAVTFIECHHNLGFAKANNIAIRQSCGDYVLLLNPDTFVAEDTLRQMVGFMDAHPKAGAAGLMMHNADGSVARESRRALPTPFVSLLKMIGCSSRYYMSKLPWDRPGRIDVVSGAFMVLRREALNKAGLLDEDFFMYGEDIDLSYRVKKSGYENWYVPARIVHYKGESTQKSSFRYVHVFYQAMLIFFRKHYGHLSLLVTIPIKLAIYFRAFVALIQMQYWRMRRSLGFYVRREWPVYAFKGSEAMVADCQAIARRNGLNCSPSPQSCEKDCCTVYDLDTYSFSEVISLAAAQPGRQIGTYSGQSRIIVTQTEIFR